jgi:hypothetical protein
MCALVLCVVLVAVFGYSTAVFVSQFFISLCSISPRHKTFTKVASVIGRRCRNFQKFMSHQTGVYRVLVGKPEGKPGRPRRRWEDNIKMDLEKVGCRDMDWIELAQYRDRWRALVIVGMNLGVP